MKKLLLTLLIAVPVAVTAQKMSFGELYDKYSGKQGFTTVEISGELIKMFGGGSVDINGDKTLSETLDGIRLIRIIVAKSVSREFQDEMKKVASGEEYKMLTSVTEDDDKQLKFYYKDKKEDEKTKKAPQSEFLMIILGEKENVALNITGDLDVKKISKLSNLNIGGLDKLDKMKDKKE